MMTGLSKMEQMIYKAAGGGEKGEAAIIERRRYLQDYDERQQSYGKEFAQQRFLPRKEKGFVNPSIEDDYDE